MGNSSKQFELQTHSSVTLAKALAPEEICAGDYVTQLYEVCELPSFLWDADATLSPRDQLVRLQYVPESGGVPLKVKSVCLPYVLVKHPRWGRQTIDIRRVKLARLSKTFAREAWDTLRTGRSKRKKKRR